MTSNSRRDLIKTLVAGAAAVPLAATSAPKPAAVPACAPAPRW